ncbi:hypothetical protein AAG570_011740 [Ranatra chinensis]|uniref:Uncharacterized protein n=1 Tax=Ranatra chinensis TaxID=642074 RepID=A0ABD0YV78_9HEMI
MQEQQHRHYHERQLEPLQPPPQPQPQQQQHRCGVCTALAAIFRRLMCIAPSRRGSQESYYQHLDQSESLASRHLGKLKNFSGRYKISGDAFLKFIFTGVEINSWGLFSVNLKEEKQAVAYWTKKVAASFKEERILKLVSGLAKCIGGNHLKNSTYIQVESLTCRGMNAVFNLKRLRVITVQLVIVHGSTRTRTRRQGGDVVCTVFTNVFTHIGRDSLERFPLKMPLAQWDQSSPHPLLTANS